MRLLIEIAIIFVAVFVVVTLINRNDNLSSANRQLKKENVELTKENNRVEDSLAYLKRQRDSIKQEEKQLLEQQKEWEKEKQHTKRIFQDSIEKAIDKELAGLVDDTTKIVERGDSAYVLLSESEYREKEINEIKLAKLQMICGLQQKELESKNKLLKLKNMRIENQKQQISQYKKQVSIKNRQLSNKQKQIDNMERKVKVQKAVQTGAVGVGIAALIISLL